ncbi:TadE/TadG family type IV pilus assembly protein [Yoonia sp.]|uniref:TadE/TadG family type IV pilus assembly protein n=1 Tax=Yoonia sp. TaxID=2212373 RepID=UPI00391CB57B
MTQTINGSGNRFERFGQDQEGSSTIEFVILFPFFMLLSLMAFELGMLNLRTMMLERATDIVVRDLRLGTGAPPDHETIRGRICDASLIIPDCQNAIRLEVRSLPISQWSQITGPAACVNHDEEINPANEFVPGMQNELMLIRVCALYKPFFPTGALATALPPEADGRYGLRVSSAFVNEPV